MATITAITTVEACRAVMKASLLKSASWRPWGRKIRQPRRQLAGVASGE